MHSPPNPTYHPAVHAGVYEALSLRVLSYPLATLSNSQLATLHLGLHQACLLRTNMKPAPMSSQEGTTGFTRPAHSQANPTAHAAHEPPSAVLQRALRDVELHMQERVPSGAPPPSSTPTQEALRWLQHVPKLVRGRL